MSPVSRQILSWDVFSKNILLIPSQSNLKLIFFSIFYFYAYYIEFIKERNKNKRECWTTESYH